ncbi:hypothetical protein BKA62DRAFT_715516, partial [Auriculariales sp. MPI-PUGE-AT-0066]
MDARRHEDKGISTMLSDSPKRVSSQNLPAVSISSPESPESAGLAPVTTPGTLSPSMPAPSPSAPLAATSAATSDSHAPTLPEKDRPVSFASASGGRRSPARLSPPPLERPGALGDRGMGGMGGMGVYPQQHQQQQQQPLYVSTGPGGPQRMDSYMSDSRFSAMGPQGSITPHAGSMTPHPGGPQMLQRGLSLSRDGGSGAPRDRGIDWIVPTRASTLVERRETVAHRLNTSLELAKKRHLSCKAKAMLYGRALNAAIGIQVAIGALITGLAAITTGRQTSIMTSVLGALSTMIGTFLARMRGSAEPDLSKSRAKGYDQYIRTVEQYIVDHGEELGRDHMDRIKEFRREFEELEGTLSAEQKGVKPRLGIKC